jgi:hypothetical protein
MPGCRRRGTSVPGVVTGRRRRFASRMRMLAHDRSNLAHGLGHGPIGALASSWPALALAGFGRDVIEVGDPVGPGSMAG